MAGLLKSAMQGAQEDEAPGGETPEAEDEMEPGEPPEDTPADAREDAAEGEVEGGGAEGDLSPRSVRAKLQIPDNLKDAYDRVVLAGMKVMFSKETSQQAMSFLSEENGAADERIGQGVAALMGLLMKQANGTMPPQIIIPAGVELVAAAGDYLKKAGENVTDDDIAGAMSDYVQIVLQQAGADSPEKMRQMLQQAQGGTPDGAPQPPAGGPAPEQAPAGAPGGMINQAMAGG